MLGRYQRRRMYTRIALGKSSAMDVVGGEASSSAGQLLLLYPAVFALQALQVRRCRAAQHSSAAHRHLPLPSRSTTRPPHSLVARLIARLVCHPACLAACLPAAMQAHVGIQLMRSNYLAFLSPEGYLVRVCSPPPGTLALSPEGYLVGVPLAPSPPRPLAKRRLPCRPCSTAPSHRCLPTCRCLLVPTA